MARLRFNKAKRDTAKTLLHKLGLEFGQHIAKNLAEPKEHHTIAFKADGKPISLGYRVTPDLRQGYSANIHFSPLPPMPKTMKEILFPMAKADKALTAKQVKAKYRLDDAELYTVKPAGIGDTSREVKLRTGTLPERHVPIMDRETGQVKVVKVGPKPKYGPVGSTPKDGGQECW
jgi:hypothetical protein